MTVILRPMTSEEFVSYEDADAHRFAETMVRTGIWSSEDAFNKAKELHAKLLPDGIHTKDHLFLVIQDDQSKDYN